MAGVLPRLRVPAVDMRAMGPVQVDLEEGGAEWRAPLTGALPRWRLPWAVPRASAEVLPRLRMLGAGGRGATSSAAYVLAGHSNDI